MQDQAPDNNRTKHPPLHTPWVKGPLALLPRPSTLAATSTLATLLAGFCRVLTLTGALYMVAFPAPAHGHSRQAHTMTGTRLHRTLAGAHPSDHTTGTPTGGDTTNAAGQNENHEERDHLSGTQDHTRTAPESPGGGEPFLDPEQIFQTAQHAYTFGDYPMVLQYLNRILYPRVLLTDEEQIKEALEIFGITAYYEDHQSLSRQAFVRLLSADPDHRLDPLVVPPQIVDFFDGIRQELDENLRELRERRRRQEQWEEMEQMKARQTLVLEQRITNRPVIVDLLPFGIGQFFQERPAWGAFFLSTQALTLGLNMGTFWAVENMRNKHGFHVSSDIEQAEYLQNVQVISLVGLGAMLVWGTIDGLVNKPPPNEEVHSYTLPAGQLPPEFAHTTPNQLTTVTAPE